MIMSAMIMIHDCDDDDQRDDDEQSDDDEHQRLQGLEDIIRDTGPVDSNLTSANASKYNSEVGHL